MILNAFPPSRVLFLGCLFSLSLMNCSLPPQSPFIKDSVTAKTIIDDGVVVYNSADFDLSIIGFKDNFEIIYEPLNPFSLEAAAQQYPYRYIINGSYFEHSRVHAGWLSIFGVSHSPVKPDRQLSHMAILDTSTGYLAFPELGLWDATLTSPKTLEFQTGPLVIHANTLDTLSIQASINGSEPHLRTLLAFTEEDAMTYFIITRKECGLDELGKQLLSLPLFSGKTLSVLNLDGGSSTALYARNHPDLNFNIRRPLPVLLGIH